MEIAAGEAVVFVNESEDFFWPASNIHPTHEILPEFESQAPSWITGVEPGPTASTNPASGTTTTTWPPMKEGWCRFRPRPAQSAAHRRLWCSRCPRGRFEPVPRDAAVSHLGIYTDDRELEAFINRFGPGGALAVLKQIELASGGDCHNRAHEAGRIAYELFGPAAFVLATHDCQSGGQHGATEALFAERGTANIAADIAALCDATENDFFRHQCVHGVGHGLMAWTNYDLPVALGLCDHAQRLDRPSCYSGVYMENVVGGLSGAMGHTTEYLRQGDPIYPCDIVEARYQPACYFYQTTRHGRGLELGHGRGGRPLRRCPRQRPLALLPLLRARFRQPGRRRPGRDHRPLPPRPDRGRQRRLRPERRCRTAFGEPVGADRAVAFCAMLDADPAAYAQSRDACYWSIQQQAGYVLATPAERRSFCDKLPANRQGGCVY